MAPSSLLSRLYQDLAELRDSPYPGVAIFTDDANVRKFCLVLTPPSGPWKNLSLHFDVELPESWPASPPRVASSVYGIDHPNLFGNYICCDLLKEKDQIERSDGYTGGYTPALTLRGLFLQFLTFFSSSKVDQDYGYTVDIGDSFIVRYVLESDLSRHPTSRNVAGAAPPQRELKRDWERDPSPVIVVSMVKSEGAVVKIQATKSSRSRPTRLFRIEERNPRWTSTLDDIRCWKCQRCPYGSAAVPHCSSAVDGAMDVNESSILLAPPATCQLGLLNDDVLFTLASHLPSESVLSFSRAYPRMHDIVHSMHVLLQRELRCFFLRTPLSNSVLGIGIEMDFRSRTLSSDFDWLSERAFVDFNVRQSIEKRDFTYFLPLAFSRPHFERVQSRIWSRLTEIDTEVQKAENQMSRNPRRRSAGPPKRQETVGVIYRMMTNIVVALMKSCDDVLNAPSNSKKSFLHASEKAVVSYCHLFHLLICLGRTTPQILHDATDRLRRFIDKKEFRVKTHVPDLGELIILIMLVISRPPVGNGPPVTWARLAGPFLEEAIVRNVRWVLKDAPHLEVLEQGPSDYRLAETFFRSKTSLRLIMFQITFLDLFFKAYGSSIARLDDNYGFPEKEIPERMVEEVKEIYRINTWPALFSRVRFPQGVGFGKERFSEMLRDAVKTSQERRYHTSSSFNQLSVLRGQRRKVEEMALRR
ncbi:hypothetical protein B0H10DRAFT_2229041 [Mycena sp. CBHHK59/15]|nr:hypothetical protein B0H10DRAFT_2229041 [Mycena sp. CBHHK59/15]